MENRNGMRMAALIIIWAIKNVLYYVKAVTKYMAIGNVRLSKVGTFFSFNSDDEVRGWYDGNKNCSDEIGWSGEPNVIVQSEIIM